MSNQICSDQIFQQFTSFTLSELKELISAHEVISFDVFDTLLARSCNQPMDVFAFIGEKLNIQNYKETRVRSEVLARQNYKSRGAEVSLGEILDFVTDDNIKRQILLNEELEAEKLFTFATPFAQKIIPICRSMGKRIIAVTDIYMSSCQVDDLLCNESIFVDHVYSSADARADNIGKFNGKMYRHVINKECVLPEALLHFGDNLVSDIAEARRNLIHAIPVKQASDVLPRNSVSEVAEKSFPEVGIVSSIVDGLGRQRIFKHGCKGALYDFGYNVGGVLLFGVCQFLINEARRNNIRKIILLQRDGKIVYQALSLLQERGIEVPFDYTLAPSSRRMTLFPLLSMGVGHDDIISILGGPKRTLTAATFFHELQLDMPDYVDGECHSTVFDHLRNYIAFVESQSDLEAQAVKEYYKMHVLSHQEFGQIAWFDVGWSLSSPHALNKLLGFEGQVFCVGSNVSARKKCKNIGYIYSNGAPRAIANDLALGVEIIELIFTSSESSYVSMEMKGDNILVKRSPKCFDEILKGNNIQKISAGALDFISDFHAFGQHLSLDALRDTSIRQLISLAQRPSVHLDQHILQIPHDRFGANGNWKVVGDYLCDLRHQDNALSNDRDDVKASCWQCLLGSSSTLRYVAPVLYESVFRPQGRVDELVLLENLFSYLALAINAKDAALATDEIFMVSKLIWHEKCGDVLHVVIGLVNDDYILSQIYFSLNERADLLVGLKPALMYKLATSLTRCNHLREGIDCIEIANEGASAPPLIRFLRIVLLARTGRLWSAYEYAIALFDDEVFRSQLGCNVMNSDIIKLEATLDEAVGDLESAISKWLYLLSGGDRSDETRDKFQSVVVAYIEACANNGEFRTALWEKLRVV